jgi:hypothetical protein
MLRLIKVGVVGVLALIGLGIAAFAWFEQQQNVVFIDNTFDHPVQLAMDGSSIGSLAPGESRVLDVEEGRHDLVATGPAGEVERGSFDVPDGSSFRGLYSLGARKAYMVVRAVYSSGGGDTQYQPLPAGQRFHVLPGDVIRDGIDRSIPSTVTTSGSQTTMVYLCHYDAATERIGCPGA